MALAGKGSTLPLELIPPFGRPRRRHLPSPHNATIARSYDDVDLSYQAVSTYRQMPIAAPDSAVIRRYCS